MHRNRKKKPSLCHNTRKATNYRFRVVLEFRPDFRLYRDVVAVFNIPVSGAQSDPRILWYQSSQPRMLFITTL